MQPRVVVHEDDNTRTRSKTKRNLENKQVSTHGKKQKATVQRAPSDSTPSQQLRRIYSADRKTAASVLLNLSVPVIFANYYMAVESMAAQSMFHVFKLLQERSIEELDAACALLQLSNSA